MAQLTLTTAETGKETAVSRSRTRLYFIDHLRAALAVLVVVHHVALVYGGSAPFYYMEFPVEQPFTFLALLIFVLLNQGWFMGAFFLLAGYFTPGSYDRKGTGPFLKAKLVRLGIPVLLFSLILNPLSLLGLWQMPAVLGGIESPFSWAFFWELYPDLIGMGPLWFVALLLIFNVGYAGWRRLAGDGGTAVSPSQPSVALLISFMLALASLSYLMRLIVPIGKELLGFPTLAYFPQYLSFFVVGIIASRRDWLRTISGKLGVAGFLIAAASLIFLFPLAFSGRLLSLELTEAFPLAIGGAHWRATVYALWDSTFAVGMTVASIPLFRTLFNGNSRFGRFLGGHSYAVYIIHIPLIVLLAVQLQGVALPSIQKFALLTAITIPVCFLTAFVLRRLPGARRVL
jgi:glucan biosynthesis protein C